MKTIYLSPTLLDQYQDCLACFAKTWRAKQSKRKTRQTGRRSTSYNLSLGMAAHEAIDLINRRLLAGSQFPSTEEVVDGFFNPSHFVHDPGGPDGPPSGYPFGS